MMKKFVIAALLLTALLSFCTALADQDGNFRYCNRDQYGCWITEEDGRRSYIMFWSEEIRQNFMGPKPAVVCPPPDDNLPILELGEVPQARPERNPVRPHPTPIPDPIKPEQPEPEIEG